jgi:hypothetical protein
MEEVEKEVVMACIVDGSSRELPAGQSYRIVPFALQTVAVHNEGHFVLSG